MTSVFVGLGYSRLALLDTGVQDFRLFPEEDDDKSPPAQEAVDLRNFFVHAKNAFVRNLATKPGVVATLSEGSVILTICGLDDAEHAAVAEALCAGDDAANRAVKLAADKLYMTGRASVGIDTAGLVFLTSGRQLSPASDSPAIQRRAMMDLPVEWRFVPLEENTAAACKTMAKYILGVVRKTFGTMDFLVLYARLGDDDAFFDLSELRSDKRLEKYSTCFEGMPIGRTGDIYRLTGGIDKARYFDANDVESNGGLFVFSDSTRIAEYGDAVRQFVMQFRAWRERLPPLKSREVLRLFDVETIRSNTAVRFIDASRTYLRRDSEHQKRLLDAIGTHGDTVVVISLARADCDSCSLQDLMLAVRNCEKLRAVFVSNKLDDERRRLKDVRCLPRDPRKAETPEQEEEAALLLDFIDIED